VFKDKSLLITGGTGSFGNAVLRRFLDSDVREIRIFSRDEKKQDDMRQTYRNPKLKFFLGDVRDESSVESCVKGVDFIFHAAALKQVPSCEFHPLQAVKTNILGTAHVLDAALRNGVNRVICLSTDKAVYPINAMGMSKALMEKVMAAKARESSSSATTICGTRYGNVMASRGSVIPLFVSQILAGKPITITDPEMTRFMMSLDDAVELVVYGFLNCQAGDLFVQKAPAATMGTLAEALKVIFEVPDHPVQVIGARHGEKLYESLLTREEMRQAVDCGDYYRIPADTRDLNYTEFLEHGEFDLSRSTEYHSHNTERLDVNGCRDLLLKLPYVQQSLQHRREPPDY
jgi:UDP-N-acetylglucosamine 4,6-dehydratase/5-epimerase